MFRRSQLAAFRRGGQLLQAKVALVDKTHLLINNTHFAFMCLVGGSVVFAPVAMMGCLRLELKTELATNKAELKADIQEVKAELKADIQKIGTDIRTALSALNDKSGVNAQLYRDAKRSRWW